MITSFRLHLAAEGKSPKTIGIYVEAAQWFAGSHLLANTQRRDWLDVSADDIRSWLAWLLDHYSDSYANNQYRALQQFFKWLAEEEDVPDPMARMSPPKVGEKVVPVFTEDELTLLTKTCRGKTFVDRRDYAIIEVFKATGIRLSEMAGIRYDEENPGNTDLDLIARELLVTGKGRKQRIVRFGHPAARAIDRYLRVRARHSQAHSIKLWLGVNNRPPMTANGIYQMIVRRGEECGVAVHPHKFRHLVSALLPCGDSRCAARREGQAPACPERCPRGVAEAPRSRAAEGRRVAIAQQPLTVEGRPRTLRGAPRIATRQALHTVSAGTRHYFSHSWLDRGGSEGDLMELNGWTSPQMLRRYGASVRNVRARRTYDRIMSAE